MTKVPPQELRKRGFIVHFVVYILVILGLVGINYTFTPDFPWWLFPAIGWGLGVLIHFLFAVVWAQDDQAEAKAEWKKHGLMRGFIIHLLAYLAGNSLLLVVNLNYNPQTLWVLYPIAGWGIGVILHLVLALLWAPKPE